MLRPIPDMKHTKNKPQHNKTNNVCPAKTQISLGIHPVWSESSLSAWRKLWSLATHWVHRESLIRLGDSDQTESSLCTQSLCWFCHEAAQIFFLVWTPLINGNRKLVRELTNAERKWLEIAFSIANCRYRLPICNLIGNLNCCFNSYRSALLDSRDSSWLPPIRCVEVSTWRYFLR